MNAEEVKLGCFQIVIVFLLGVNYVIVAMSHALPAFHNYTPKFYCQMKNVTNRTYGCPEVQNSTLGNNASFNIAEVDESRSCSGEYQFITDFGENSVVTEWGLVCEKRYLTYLAPTVYYLGVLIGAWISGVLSDRIGRLPVKALCLYTQGSMAVALYVAQSYPAFLALRALQGIFVQGLQNSTYILSLELVPAQARTLVALVMQISWALGLLLLAVLSYVIPDWRILQLAISVPTAVTVLYIWIIPESPRWLIAKGKSTEADMALERIAKYNNCCTRPSSENQIKHEEILNTNITPVKPERKSRVSNLDVKKTNNDCETKEEAVSLLTNFTSAESETSQKRVRKSSRKTLSENLNENLPKLEPLKEKPKLEGGEVEIRDMPSSSKSHRKSKSISQPVYNQRVSMKTAYDIVELRKPTDQEKTVEENKDNRVKSIDEEKANGQAANDFWKMFRCSLLRKYSMVMTFQWLTSSLACCIFMTSLPNFPINRHVTFALGGVLEIATYTFLYFILSRYGRRLPLSMYQSLSGFICILLAALIKFSKLADWFDLAKMAISLLGRVMTMSTVSITYLYTVEIFPTVARGTCLGLCVVFAKIGSLCTPHVLLSGEYVSPLVPLITIGMLCLVSGSLPLLLPETLNKVLPDKIEDTELLVVQRRVKKDNESLNNEKSQTTEDLTEREILRAKLFSEDWVDAGNGILVNFSESKGSESK